MRFMPLRVSCPGPVRRLVSLGGAGGLPGPFPPVPGSGSCAPPWAGLCVRGGPAPGGGGGGAVRVPRPLLDVVGGPRGAGCGGSLCLGPCPCLP